MNQKQTNELETRLRSWALRAPSPTLNARLFQAPQRETLGDRQAPVNWLVPAMAAALVLYSGITYRPGGVYDRLPAQPSLIASVNVSNRSDAALSAASAVCTRNSICGDNFEWTNAGGSISSVVPFSSSRGTK